jgi:eukaryotic-like serine/threonine-protein kinase
VSTAILGRIGKYELKSKIGEGTLGPMLLAIDTVLAREVAIKVIRGSLPQGVRDAIGSRLRKEARAVAALSHPNVCTLHDLGEDAQFGVYAVYEYVRGPSLRARLNDSVLTPDEVATLAREVGSALAFAHESGTLHRDVRPENILLSRFGSQLTDFGLGNVQDIVPADTEGVDASPSPYTSPETVQRSMYTSRNDQYAFALVLAECMLGYLPKDLAGPFPFEGCEPRLAASLNQLILRGLSEHPEDRFPTCRDLGDAVATAIQSAKQGADPSPPRLSLSGGFPIAVQSEPPQDAEFTQTTPAAQAPQRHNVIIGLALVILCALVLTRRSGDRAEQQGVADASATSPARPSARPALAKPSADHTSMVEHAGDAGSEASAP